MLRSDLCDYSDACIVVKGDITALRGNNDAYDKKLAFKNNESFISCILKINNTLIDNAEDLDIVMPMYRKTTIMPIIGKQQKAYGIITEMNQIVALMVQVTTE